MVLPGPHCPGQATVNTDSSEVTLLVSEGSTLKQDLCEESRLCFDALHPKPSKGPCEVCLSDSGRLGGQVTGTTEAYFVAVPQAISAWLPGMGFRNKQVVVTGSQSP